jgi:hypothetical protein
MSALPGDNAGIRTTTSAVTFAHPFRLGSDSRDLPPGTYTLHTDERLFTSGDRRWSVRAEVVVEVQQGSHKAFRHVTPADLDSAVASDAARSAVLHAAGGNLGLAQP